jgi:hypothetical protein
MRFWLILVVCAAAAGGAQAKTHKRHKSTAATTAPVAPSSPDGAWTIEATTSVGACPALIPTALTIADNKLERAEGAEVTTWGYVDDSGNIVARFTGEGGRVARFHGLLKGGKGSGAWSSSTDMCGGTWRGALR